MRRRFAKNRIRVNAKLLRSAGIRFNVVRFNAAQWQGISTAHWLGIGQNFVKFRFTHFKIVVAYNIGTNFVRFLITGNQQKGEKNKKGMLKKRRNIHAWIDYL